MTITFQSILGATAALGLLHLSAPVVAQTPADVAPATESVEQPTNHPSDETEQPAEMKFGHRPSAEAAPAPTAVASPEIVEVAPALRRARTMEEVADAAVGELNIHTTRWRYSLNFFGDVSIAQGHPADPDHHLGFSIGAQDVLIRGELNKNIVATTEIAIEPGPDGISIDLERFYVRWQSSCLFAEAGRTHTGIGYWNNAYHHGRWLQPTIARPRWVAFEDDGGILPVHWVGADIGAHLPIGPATLNLMASVGNGRGRIVDDVRNDGDYQSMKAFHGAIELVGLGVPELRVGAAGIFDRIPGWTDRALLPSMAIDETIGSAHIVYVNVPLLFISEGYLVQHKASGQKWTTYGGFALIGFTMGQLTPYLEGERIASRGGADPFFTITTPGLESGSFDTIEGIVGLRLDLTDWTALKLEYRQTRARDVRTTLYEGVLNWSWGF